jgi:hypothetical protein
MKNFKLYLLSGLAYALAAILSIALLSSAGYAMPKVSSLFSNPQTLSGLVILAICLHTFANLFMKIFKVPALFSTTK